MTSTPKIKKTEARNALWWRGNLSWKLHSLQKKIYDHFYGGRDPILTMLISRQTGKSYLMLILAIEQCIRQEKSIVKYVCQTQDMVKNIIHPNMDQILSDCPDALKPEWRETDKRYIFPNGSQIHIAGSDKGNYNKLRGGRSWLWIVDEAGFCSELDTIVRSVLSPTTLTTKGRGILASTPDPDKPDHEFIHEFVEPAQAEGRLFKYTIFDNPMLTAERVQEIIASYPGGVKHPKFRAEYLCEIVRSEDSVVVPEFDAETEKEIVKVHPRPPWFDTYVAMDIGGKDFTVLLLGYFDFLINKVIIEDEIVLKTKQNSSQIASLLKSKLRELWDEKPVYMMWADNNNHILLNDLSMMHQLNFLKTDKTDKQGAINKLRVLIGAKDILINPKCVTLIYHVRNATWAKSRTSNGHKTFARASDGSHYDALDAAIYLVRNIVYSKNPYPAGYTLPNVENAYIRSQPQSEIKPFLKLFKRRN